MTAGRAGRVAAERGETRADLAEAEAGIRKLAAEARQ